jgi:hypothetical protein
MIQIFRDAEVFAALIEQQLEAGRLTIILLHGWHLTLEVISNLNQNPIFEMASRNSSIKYANWDTISIYINLGRLED